MFLHNNWKNGWCFLTTVSFFYWLLADRMSFCYTIFERRRSWSFGSWLEFPPRVWLTLPNRRHAEKRAAITKSDNASDFGQKHCYYIPLNLKGDCNTLMLLVSLNDWFYRCPPTSGPFVLHRFRVFPLPANRPAQRPTPTFGFYVSATRAEWCPLSFSYYMKNPWKTQDVNDKKITLDERLSSSVSFIISGFMLAVSRDALPNICIAAGNLSPRRGLTVSPWRGRDTLPSIWTCWYLPSPTGAQLLRAATRYSCGTCPLYS